MRIDLGFSVTNETGKRDSYYLNITRAGVIDRIKNHPAIDPWTRDYLFNRINEYPDNALVYFVKNINKMVTAALNERSRVLKERNEESSSSKIGIGTQEQGGGSSGTGIGEVEESQEEDRESLFRRSGS